MTPHTAPAAAGRPGRHPLAFRASALIVFSMLAFPSSPRAAAGDLDTGTDVAVQPDGKIVMVGTSTIATSPSINRDFGIVRLDPDGTLDGSFGSGGRVTLDITGLGRDDKAFAVAIQEDGKILIGG